MAFTNSSLILNDPGSPNGVKSWSYKTTDALATVRGANYFAGCYIQGMRIGDFIQVAVVDSIADPTSLTATGYAVVSAASASTGNCTAAGALA